MERFLVDAGAVGEDERRRSSSDSSEPRSLGSFEMLQEHHSNTVRPHHGQSAPVLRRPDDVPSTGKEKFNKLISKHTRPTQFCILTRKKVWCVLMRAWPVPRVPWRVLIRTTPAITVLYKQIVSIVLSMWCVDCFVVDSIVLQVYDYFWRNYALYKLFIILEWNSFQISNSYWFRLF